jgi:hypothetical protein
MYAISLSEHYGNHLAGKIIARRIIRTCKKTLSHHINKKNHDQRKKTDNDLSREIISSHP